MYISEVIQNVIEKYFYQNNKYIRYIYDFEKKYAEFGMNLHVINRILELEFDVFKAMREDKVVYEKTYARLSGRDGKIQ